jgi:hypothetical protein
MIIPFKFFKGKVYTDELEFPALRVTEEGASWQYGRRENLHEYQYDIMFDNHYGIHSFLNHFPSGYVVVVISITGPNGRIHNADTSYLDGWGFDILSDLITVEWVRFRP